MTDLAKFKDVPKSALQFAMGVVNIAKLQEGEDQDTARRFEMVAHSGAIMPSPWFGQIAVDLEGVKVNRQDLPALRNHEDDRIVGHTEKITVDTDQGILAEGIMHPFTTDGADVLALADNGFPWQTSVYVPPTRVEDVSAGAETEVNGHKFVGPGIILRESVLREVSFCALGRDENTSAACFADRGDTVDLSDVEFVVSPDKENDMNMQEVTLDMLKAERPELIEQLGSTFSANADEAAKARAAELDVERVERTEAVFKAAAEFGVDLAGVKDALMGADTVEVITARFARAKLSAIQSAAATQPGGNDEPAAPNTFGDLEGKELWEAQYKADKKLRREFGTLSVYQAYMRAQSEGRVKILSDLEPRG